LISLAIVLTSLAVSALFLLLLPVLRAHRALPGRAGYDAAVYRDQLKELERDVARGLIGEAEAQSARLEIERRLLAAANAAPDGTLAARRSPALALLVVLLVAGGATGLYWTLGAPGVPDMPFALRVAEHTGPGGDAGAAPEAAHEAFDQAVKADPGNILARFYLATADAQAGRGRPAIDAWVKLAGETSDADMRGEIARRVAETAKLSGITAPPLPPVPAANDGPGQDQLAAAAGLSEAERANMINGMVAQLAAKLEANPNDVDGWLRLGRSYAVLGEHDKSAAAFERAATLKPNDATVLLAGVEALMQGQKPDAPIPQRAVDLLRRAETADPKRPDTLWYLGIAEAQAGHVEAAQGYWRRVLDLLPPDSPDRKMVTDAIENVKKH